LFTASPTLAQLRASLANRLGDPGMVRWLSAEIDQIINDAIRTWNCAALYHRARGTFNTIANQSFYDLTAELTVLAKTSTVQDVCSAVEYRLLEPQTTNYSNPWTGTEQFSFAKITDAIQKRLSRFYMDSAMLAEELALISVSPGDGRIAVGERSQLDVRRVAWKSVEGQFSNLWRVDEETLNRRFIGWNIDAATPESFTVLTAPETVIQLAPVPIDSGNLHVLAVQSAPAISLTANTALGIMEDFVPYLIWGVLAELLGQDGPGQDSARAAYCEQRWAEGLQLAQMVSTDLQVRVNEQAVPVMALEHLDWGVPGWQHTTGTPEVAAQAAPNLIAFYKVPDDSYGITVDVARNAPLLVNDTDHIQLADEFLGCFQNYCLHVSLFKDGEIQETASYYKEFFEAAAGFNNALRQFTPNLAVLSQQSQLERRVA
jgi:hypothetical protein